MFDALRFKSLKGKIPEQASLSIPVSFLAFLCYRAFLCQQTIDALIKEISLYYFEWARDAVVNTV
jgi:hypothetical protein